MTSPDAIQSNCRKLAATCLVFMVITGIYSAVPAAGSAVRTLYLIRHGEYDHDDTRDPDIGKGLVPLGVAQAELIAARLAAMPVTMTSLHSSSMTRASETAQIVGHLFPNLTLQSSRDLRECTPPTHRQDIMAELAEEEATRCRLQLEQAFSHYFQPTRDSDTHDIIVCHGNVIRYFVCRALGVDPMAWLGMSIANCSLTVIRIKADGSLKIVSFSDVGHLSPDQQTYPGRKRTAPQTMPD